YNRDQPCSLIRAIRVPDPCHPRSVLEGRPMPTPSELADQYLAGAAIRQAVKGMTREHLTARPVPGRWSTLEVVCHVADFEPVFADRMKRIIALGDTPLLLAADENLYAKAFNYHDRDVEE